MNDSGICYKHEVQETVKGSDDTNRKIYLDSVDIMKCIFNDVSVEKKLDYKSVFHISKSLYSYRYSIYNISKTILESQNIEDYTYIHSVNTGIYSMLIGEWLNFTDNEIKKLICCGLLHDIGKARIPKKILNKNGQLDHDEIKLMEEHPILGFEILDKITSIAKEIKNAALLHHERIDGTGYPFYLKSDEIGIYPRIVAAADVFDAMTTDRVYKKAVSPYNALDMFRTVGSGMFDNRVIDVILNNMPSLIVHNQKMF